MRLDRSAMRFFRDLATVLIFLFFTTGGFLVHDSIVSPGTKQSWSLLAGALLCSLGAFTAYFLFRPVEEK
jgi:hypothetical protein